MTSDDGIGIGELSRQVRDVFARFEGLAHRLEDGQFVRTDIFILYKENLSHLITSLQEKTRALSDEKADKDTLAGLSERITQLEDDKKWLIRLVIGFVILAILGLLVAANGGIP